MVMTVLCRKFVKVFIGYGLKRAGVSTPAHVFYIQSVIAIFSNKNPFSLNACNTAGNA
jgi:hypothetical protein